MPVTQADLDNLNAALTSGVHTVRKSDGTMVQYRSTAEILAAIDEVTRQLRVQARVMRPRRVVVIHGGRGFDRGEGGY
jgi:hypothetical protein